MEMKQRETQNGAGPDENTGYANKGYKAEHGSCDEVAIAVVDGSATEALEDDEEINACIACIIMVTEASARYYEANKRTIWLAIYSILVLLYAGYFIYAMTWSFGDEGSIRLLLVTCFAAFCVIVYIMKKYFGKKISSKLHTCNDVLSRNNERISWIMVAIIWGIVIIYVIVDVATISKNPYNLVSAAGIAIYTALMFIFSYNPSQVRWRPVVWGLALQFVFALLILRWNSGFLVFDWLGKRITEFLAHSDSGARFIFGDRLINEFVFAFNILSVVVFFSTAISILYYLGVMQKLIYGVAWVMQITMATTAAESLNAAGNIFVGMTEAPLLIRPLLQDMTRSELHAVMTGGFATIAGSVLGAYISFGIPANHLLSASVMSAPAALAMAKLFYPETEKSRTTVDDVKEMGKSEARNIVEAASIGAAQSIVLVANIAVNLIAFISILHFLNETLRWFGARAGFLPPDYDFSFEFITSYVLWPFAFIMGVEVIDCLQVARLIGLKTFLNEFVAYTHLATLVDNRLLFLNHMSQNGTWENQGNNIILTGLNTTQTLVSGILHTERSIVISTYALCGFANISSIGIMIGALSGMAPHRRSDFASLGVRALIAGNVACFMTACIAGLFYDGTVANSF